MASDGCQTPTWTGSAFSYLMHQPAKGSNTYRDNLPSAAATRAPVIAANQAVTGVWDGPAPRTQLRGDSRGVPGTNSVDGPEAVVHERQPDAVPLRSGKRLPLIGFGTDKVKSVATIRAALDAGYRHFDCAAMYGTQPIVGDAIGSWIRQHGRDSLFLTSKVWNNAHRPRVARRSVEQSVKELGVDKLDLLLMHWPVAWTPDSTLANHTDDTETTIHDTWQAMESMVDDGIVTTIGVSNFGEKALRDLIAQARIKPAVNQIELHPYLSQRRLVGACLRMGVACEAYSPLGNRKGGLMDEPVIIQLAERLCKTPSQVVLRWNVQRGVAVIPSSSSPDHLRDNIHGLFDWRLTQQQKAKLDALDQGKRLADVDWHRWED